jgi:hypothetical protein
MMIEVYVAESTLLRTEKLVSKTGEGANALQTKLARVYLSEAVEKVNNAGKEAVAGFVKGDEQKVMLMGLKRFTKMNPVNTIQLRREIAGVMIGKSGYPLV